MQLCVKVGSIPTLSSNILNTNHDLVIRETLDKELEFAYILVSRGETAMELKPSDLNTIAAGLRMLVEHHKKKKLPNHHPTRQHTQEILARVEAEILKNWQETKI